jgi:hypothetical protein
MSTFIFQLEAKLVVEGENSLEFDWSEKCRSGQGRGYERIKRSCMDSVEKGGARRKKGPGLKPETFIFMVPPP